MWSRRGAGIVSLMSLLIIGAAAVAYANHIDNIVPTINYDKSCLEGSVNGGGTVCLTDNSDVSYYMDNFDPFKLEAGDRQVVSAMLSSEYAPTHLAILYDSSPTFSGTGETDIVYQEGDVPGSNEGITWCNDASPIPRYLCDQQMIRIEAGHYNPGLSCHETGHAVGLLHGADSVPSVSNMNPDLGCMQKPVSNNETLGGNQYLNINSVYSG